LTGAALTRSKCSPWQRLRVGAVGLAVGVASLCGAAAQAVSADSALSVAALALPAEKQLPLADSTPATSNYVRVGDTVFVSGRLAEWFGKLLSQFPHPDDASALQEDALHPERRVRHIVLVNALGRPERTLGIDLLAPRLAGRPLITTVIGRCDVFCNRLFLAGTQRHFGQTLPGQDSWIDIRPPIDLETERLENRWPEKQIEALTRFRPELKTYAPRWLDALRQTQDDSGGLRIYLQRPAQFCPSATQPCQTFPDMTARAMGLVTQPDPVPIALPPSLAIASPDAPWPPFFNRE